MKRLIWLVIVIIVGVLISFTFAVWPIQFILTVCSVFMLAFLYALYGEIFRAAKRYQKSKQYTFKEFEEFLKHYNK